MSRRATRGRGQLEGSKDGLSWSVLDQHKDEPVFERRHQERTYGIANPTSWQFFRFTFQPNAGVEHFQVAEIGIDGVTADAASGPQGAKNYRRELDLSGATARVEYEREGVRYERTHFVSAPDQAFVSRLTASRRGALSFEVSLDRPERFTTTVAGPSELLMTGTLNDGRGGKGVTYAARRASAGDRAEASRRRPTVWWSATPMRLCCW